MSDTLIQRIWHKIRVWNVWFNPFFSPSLYAIDCAKEFFEGFTMGVARAQALEGVIVGDEPEKDETRLLE